MPPCKPRSAAPHEGRTSGSMVVTGTQQMTAAMERNPGVLRCDTFKSAKIALAGTCGGATKPAEPFEARTSF
ncbi:hypothetical protein BRAS3809_5670003 [Bradyrhizobium sp. STM 3809]|nr:hypothetical protein BRAS3809_5670003 [Bradyrhizobium sp. STM 3809]